jgi:hypothetical protein
MDARLIPPLLVAGKFAIGLGGKLMIKSYILANLVGIKAFLVPYIGATAAKLSLGAIAGAIAAMYWARVVERRPEHEVIDIGAKSVSRNAAIGLLAWMVKHGLA